MDYPLTGHTDETLSPEAMFAMFHLVNGTGSVEGDEEGGDIKFKIKGGAKVAIILSEFPLDLRPRDAETAEDLARTREEFFARNFTGPQCDKQTIEGLRYGDYKVTVEVEKTEGKQMGLQLKTVAGKAVVSKVESGPLEEYNKNNPSTAVKEGDTILSANGKTGKASDIANGKTG